MLEAKSDNAIVAAMIRPENIDLVCEIYNDFCRTGARDADSDDPVFKFLRTSENAAVTEHICREYPSAIKFLATMGLLKGVQERCQARLRSEARWRVVLDPEDHGKLLRDRWPAVSIEPQPGQEECWTFYLQIDANVKKLPFTMAHGVVCTVAGGHPASMTNELIDALEATKRLFREQDFKVMTSNWLAVTQKPYKDLTLGDDADVLASLLDGTLAEDISGEFLTLFEYWSDEIEKLNSMIT